MYQYPVILKCFLVSNATFDAVLFLKDVFLCKTSLEGLLRRHFWQWALQLSRSLLNSNIVLFDIYAIL